jgi:hypothetical protein
MSNTSYEEWFTVHPHELTGCPSHVLYQTPPTLSPEEQKTQLANDVIRPGKDANNPAWNVFNLNSEQVLHYLRDEDCSLSDTDKNLVDVACKIHMQELGAHPFYLLSDFFAEYFAEEIAFKYPELKPYHFLFTLGGVDYTVEYRAFNEPTEHYEVVTTITASSFIIISPSGQQESFPLENFSFQVQRDIIDAQTQVKALRIYQENREPFSLMSSLVNNKGGITRMLHAFFNTRPSDLSDESSIDCQVSLAHQKLMSLAENLAAQILNTPSLSVEQKSLLASDIETFYRRLLEQLSGTNDRGNWLTSKLMAINDFFVHLGLKYPLLDLLDLRITTTQFVEAVTRKFMMPRIDEIIATEFGKANEALWLLKRYFCNKHLNSACLNDSNIPDSYIRDMTNRLEERVNSIMGAEKKSLDEKGLALIMLNQALHACHYPPVSHSSNPTTNTLVELVKDTETNQSSFEISLTNLKIIYATLKEKIDWEGGKAVDVRQKGTLCLQYLREYIEHAEKATTHQDKLTDINRSMFAILNHGLRLDEQTNNIANRAVNVMQAEQQAAKKEKVLKLILLSFALVLPAIIYGFYLLGHTPGAKSEAYKAGLRFFDALKKNEPTAVTNTAKTSRTTPPLSYYFTKPVPSPETTAVSQPKSLQLRVVQ